MGKKIYNAAIIGCGNIAWDYDIKIQLNIRLPMQNHMSYPKELNL